MRNNALDFAKIVACFFIVFVHVGSYSELPSPWGETLRVMTRWAVPFFFLASGYTIGNSDAGSILKRVNKLISILFFGSIIYIPIVFLQNGGDCMKTINKILSQDTFHYGLNGHLWFIGSLIAGLLLFWFARSNLSHRQSLSLSLIIMFMCWFGDAIKSFGVQMWFFYLFRYLAGFALVYVGWCIGSCRVRIPKNKITLILCFGTCLLAMGMEYFVAFSFFDGTHGERQFPLACIPASIILLMLCAKVEMKNNYLSYLGANYSLGIYIIHPFIIYILGKSSGFLRVHLFSSEMLLLAFSISLFILILLHKYVPSIYNKLNGIGVK
jgi:surface polysaccharide O-acyltransferase-like enzyme